MFVIQEKNNYAKVMISQIEPQCHDMIKNVLTHPACTNLVAIMPDTHLGVGIVIGFTCEMNDKVVPNWVGVDINCGVLCANLGKIEIDLESLDKHIRENIPLARNIHNSPIINFKDDFNWNKVNNSFKDFATKYKEKFNIEIEDVTYDYEWFLNKCKTIKVNHLNVESSIGTLGGGNHFIELSKDDDGNVWLLIHSGSRNFGKSICDHHNNVIRDLQELKSKKLYEKKLNEILSDDSNKQQRSELIKNLKTKELEVGNNDYLEGKYAVDYLVDMIFTQEYADFNRTTMCKIITNYLGVEVKEIVHTNHNYIDFDDWIIRKGAVKSYKDEKFIVPLNMRDGSLMCIGKSNPEWNYSAPHGAGRIFSRTKARKTISLSDFEKSMEGIYSTSVTESNIDESPFAYKDSEIIKEAIDETCEIVSHLKSIFNLKA